MSTIQWLLGIHVLGAFLFVSGAVVAGLFHSMAMRREQPSEVASLLGLARAGVAAVGIGSVVSLGFGIWLVDRLPSVHIEDAWVVAALALWVVSGLISEPGGRRLRRARELAERLAASKAPSGELARVVSDPLTLVLNYLSLALVLAILGLMIWKPA